MMYGVDRKDLEHVWSHLDSCFNELSHAKLFITGGTGFFGCWLLESLIFAIKEFKLKIEIYILTRDIERFQKKCPHFFNLKNVNFYEGDIRDFSFPVGKFTHLIHAATEASAQLNEKHPLKMYETIFQGTKHVLDFAQAAQIKKMLFVSSGAVYGKQPEHIAKLSEKDMGGIDPLLASSAYGLGKLMAEHLSSICARKLNFDLKIARCFAFVGPYLPLDTHFAIGNFIKNVIAQDDILIKGDGTPLRSYLYASDLVIWLLKILCDGEPMGIYNVGSEQPISIENLAHLVNAQNGYLSKVIIRDLPLEGQAIAKYIPSTQKTQKELGIYQYVSLQEAIKKTIFWNLNK
jgi:nucleoside-diphosphate-sugar epimerase